MSASNTVKVSKTKTIRLTDGKKSPRNLIYRRRKRPQLKNCVWSLSEAIKNATFWIRSEMYQENFKIGFTIGIINLLAAKFLPRRPPFCLL